MDRGRIAGQVLDLDFRRFPPGKDNRGPSRLGGLFLSGSAGAFESLTSSLYSGIFSGFSEITSCNLCAAFAATELGAEIEPESTVMPITSPPIPALESCADE